jgi:hypothetical protein
MSDKTGPLTFSEFEILTDLLRRFAINHCQPTSSELARVYLTRASVRSASRAEQDAANDPLVQLLDKTPVPMTAGPNPIPVSELLNAETGYEQLSAYIAMGEHR